MKGWTYARGLGRRGCCDQLVGGICPWFRHCDCGSMLGRFGEGNWIFERSQERREMKLKRQR